MEYKLEDLIDIQQFQELQNKLNEIYAFPSAIIDLEGKILTATAWQDICTKFHRVNPESEKECIKSDQYIRDHLDEAAPAVIYRCPHGLVDTATPIIINGKHLANFFTGQFFFEKPDPGFFKARAQKYQFEEKLYLEAVSKVPVWTKDNLTKYLTVIKTFTDLLAEVGQQRLTQIETQKQIQQDQLRYRALLDSSMDGYWEADMTGTILMVNDTLCRMLGYKEAELIGKPIAEIEAIEDPDNILFHIDKVRSRGWDRFETKHRTKNGEIIDVEISVQYLPHLGGRTYCFLRDITQREFDRKRIISSEEKFSKAFKNAPVLLTISLQATGEFIDVNDKFLEVSGFSREEVIGKTSTEIGWVKQEERTRLVDSLITSRRIADYEMNFYCKNGTVVSCSYNAELITIENQVYIFSMALDQTRRKLMEESLLESEYFFRASQRAGNIGSYKTDFRKGFWESSEVLDEIFGIDRDYCRSIQGWLDIVHPDDREMMNRYLAEEVIGKRQPFSKAYRIIRKSDGETRWLNGMGKVTFDTDDNVISLTGTIQDITERKLADEEIRTLNKDLDQKIKDRTAELTEAVKEMEAFSYSVSHDLRSPLRALNGFSHLLNEDYGSLLDEQGKRMLNMIAENATSMGNLIDDLLHFSRLNRQEVKPVRIQMKEMAERVFEEIATHTSSSGIDFFLKELPEARGDEVMIRQVWVNLIGNAVKFSAKKAHPVIEIGCMQTKTVNTYYIKDNGAGFDMQFYSKLFGVFQRLHGPREFEGTGIGLSFVERIIKRHGGRVWAEGKVDEGATFYFSLPA